MQPLHRFLLISSALLPAVFLAAHPACAADRGHLALHIETTHPVASFTPDEAFGASLDGLEEKHLEDTYTPANIKTMAAAPYNRLAYRLRTELGVEAWHWNEKGTWSNAAKQEGYWTSSETTDKPLLKSYGYRLPRRGSTIDQAGNDGYSRLDDGDKTTFWKSNPYLDAHFTREDNTLHPQWIHIDLGKPQPVNALRILWADPYATRFDVQYWVPNASDPETGEWLSFTHGRVQDGKGGDALIRLEETPISTRFVRIMLSASSGTGPQSNDVRDRLGYAVRELFLGTLEANGRLRDIIRHGASKEKQTEMLVSSTDPWHRASDRNPNSVHPGFDRLITSGLGKKKPILMPVAMMYDTPENAAAEIRFLKARGVPMQQIELGEEPDGQRMSPEHYGALYLQFATIVHAIDPALVTGGPCFQSEVSGWYAMDDAQGENSWMKRFLAYLHKHNRLQDFGFFSFEWYPSDGPCSAPSEQLLKHPSQLRQVFDNLDREGVPRAIPWIISEYGYSSFARRVEVELPSALMNTEIVLEFLSLGGKTAYYYGLEPNVPILETDQCNQKELLWGNLMMFQAGSNGEAKWRLPAYYGSKMMIEEWAEQTNAPHQLFRASVKEGAKIVEDVTAYAVLRPDRQWALMLLNKSTEPIELGEAYFDSAKASRIDWSGPLDVIQYSAKQYIWHPNGPKGYPSKSEPPEHFRLAEGAASGIILPPLSMTVVRGAGPTVP